MEKHTLNLLVSHPTIDPKSITDSLELEPYVVQRSGDQITTPVGTQLSGRYTVTKWSYLINLDKYEEFCDELYLLIEHLFARKEFFLNLKEEGGKCEVFFRISNPKYCNGLVNAEMLGKMSLMQMEFGFEIFIDQEL